jgi:hypothetical protein
LLRLLVLPLLVLKLPLRLLAQPRLVKLLAVLFWVQELGLLILAFKAATFLKGRSLVPFLAVLGLL